LDLTGTIQNPQDRTNDKPLLRRAKSSLAARLTRRFGDNYVGLDALASSRRPDVDLITGSSIYDGGYTLFNLTGGIKLGQHFNLEARVENLLDKHYQTAAGYNQPGATYYATLRYSY
jgi:vitamin B12 transporter